MSPRYERMMAGAAAYAAADKSDPFTYSRAVSHIKNGVASIEGDKDMTYGAERVLEMRTLPDGETYPAEAYKNLVRP